MLVLYWVRGVGSRLGVVSTYLCKAIAASIPDTRYPISGLSCELADVKMYRISVFRSQNRWRISEKNNVTSENISSSKVTFLRRTSHYPSYSIPRWGFGVTIYPSACRLSVDSVRGLASGGRRKKYPRYLSQSDNK